MALEANAATFNAAVDVLLAAWEAYLDATTDNTMVQVVKMDENLDAVHTGTSGHPKRGYDGLLTAAHWNFGKKFKGPNTPGVADSIATTIGASGALFFKVTNAANELS